MTARGILRPHRKKLPGAWNPPHSERMGTNPQNLPPKSPNPRQDLKENCIPSVPSVAPAVSRKPRRAQTSLQPPRSASPDGARDPSPRDAPPGTCFSVGAGSSELLPSVSGPPCQSQHSTHLTRLQRSPPPRTSIILLQRNLPGELSAAKALGSLRREEKKPRVNSVPSVVQRRPPSGKRKEACL